MAGTPTDRNRPDNSLDMLLTGSDADTFIPEATSNPDVANALRSLMMAGAAAPPVATNCAADSFPADPFDA